MRSLTHFTLITASLASAAMLGGCISSSREVQEQPAPIVEVTPLEPRAPVAKLPSSTSETTTTTWDHGAVTQRQSNTIDSNGALQKQTTTTWDYGGELPSQTTITTTTPGSTTN
jgi:hypothetical protein